MSTQSKSSPYVYFMYSTEHVNKRNEVESTLGLRFECGTVIVNGIKKKYSFMSTNKKFLNQYPDATLVTEGYKNSIKYTDCNTVIKRGN